MHSYLYRYLQRDVIMIRDKKEVEQARHKLMCGKTKMSARQALKKIKKAMIGAIKEKINIG